MRVLALLALLAVADNRVEATPSPTPQPTPAWEPGTVWIWVDDAGRMHAVDQAELIPPEARARARRTTMVTGGAPPAARSPTPPPEPARPTPAPTPRPTATPKPDLHAERNELLLELYRIDEEGIEVDDVAAQEHIRRLEARLREIEAALPSE